MEKIEKEHINQAVWEVRMYAFFAIAGLILLSVIGIVLYSELTSSLPAPDESWVPLEVRAKEASTSITSNNWKIDWYTVYDGFHKVYVISVQNLDASQSRSANLTALIDQAKLDLNLIQNVQMYEWKNVTFTKSVITQEYANFSIFEVNGSWSHILKDSFVSSGISSSELMWKLTNLINLPSSNSKKFNTGGMNIPKLGSATGSDTSNGTKWFKLEFDSPPASKSSRLAIEIDGYDYHPLFNTSKDAYQNLTFSNLKGYNREAEFVTAFINFNATANLTIGFVATEIVSNGQNWSIGYEQNPIREVQLINDTYNNRSGSVEVPWVLYNQSIGMAVVEPAWTAAQANTTYIGSDGDSSHFRFGNNQMSMRVENASGGIGTMTIHNGLTNNILCQGEVNDNCFGWYDTLEAFIAGGAASNTCILEPRYDSPVRKKITCTGALVSLNYTIYTGTNYFEAEASDTAGFHLQSYVYGGLTTNIWGTNLAYNTINNVNDSDGHENSNQFSSGMNISTGTRPNQYVDWFVWSSSQATAPLRFWSIWRDAHMYGRNSGGAGALSANSYFRIRYAFSNLNASGMQNTTHGSRALIESIKWESPLIVTDNSVETSGVTNVAPTINEINITGANQSSQTGIIAFFGRRYVLFANLTDADGDATIVYTNLSFINTTRTIMTNLVPIALNLSTSSTKQIWNASYTFSTSNFTTVGTYNLSVITSDGTLFTSNNNTQFTLSNGFINCNATGWQQLVKPNITISDSSSIRLVKKYVLNAQSHESLDQTRLNLTFHDGIITGSLGVNITNDSSTETPYSKFTEINSSLFWINQTVNPSIDNLNNGQNTTNNTYVVYASINDSLNGILTESLQSGCSSGDRGNCTTTLRVHNRGYYSIDNLAIRINYSTSNFPNLDLILGDQEASFNYDGAGSTGRPFYSSRTMNLTRSNDLFACNEGLTTANLTSTSSPSTTIDNSNNALASSLYTLNTDTGFYTTVDIGGNSTYALVIEYSFSPLTTPTGGLVSTPSGGGSSTSTLLTIINVSQGAEVNRIDVPSLIKISDGDKFFWPAIDKRYLLAATEPLESCKLVSIVDRLTPLPESRCIVNETTAGFQLSVINKNKLQQVEDFELVLITKGTQAETRVPAKVTFYNLASYIEVPPIQVQSAPDLLFKVDKTNLQQQQVIGIRIWALAELFIILGAAASLAINRPLAIILIIFSVILPVLVL